MRVQSLGQEDPLEKEMATRSSIPAWEIPQTEELDGLQSVGSQRIRQDLATPHAAVNDGFCCSTSSPIVVIASVCSCGLSNRRVVAPPCCHSLHFSNGIRPGPSFICWFAFYTSSFERHPSILPIFKKIVFLSLTEPCKSPLSSIDTVKIFFHSMVCCLILFTVSFV